MHYRNIICAAWLMLGLCSTVAAQPQCSPQSMRGTWSASFSGWQTFTVGPLVGQTVPIVGLAVPVSDYQGRFTGPGTIVIGGVAYDFQMTGTVELTPDCTGAIKYAIHVKGAPNPEPGFVERLVFDPKKDEAVTVSVRSPGVKPMWITTIKRLSALLVPVTWPEI